MIDISRWIRPRRDNAGLNRTLYIRIPYVTNTDQRRSNLHNVLSINILKEISDKGGDIKGPSKDTEILLCDRRGGT